MSDSLSQTLLRSSLRFLAVPELFSVWQHADALKRGEPYTPFAIQYQRIDRFHEKHPTPIVLVGGSLLLAMDMLSMLDRVVLVGGIETPARDAFKIVNVIVETETCEV